MKNIEFLTKQFGDCLSEFNLSPAVVGGQVRDEYRGAAAGASSSFSSSCTYRDKRGQLDIIFANCAKCCIHICSSVARIQRHRRRPNKWILLGMGSRLSQMGMRMRIVVLSVHKRIVIRINYRSGTRDGINEPSPCLIARLMATVERLYS